MVLFPSKRRKVHKSLVIHTNYKAFKLLLYERDVENAIPCNVSIAYIINISVHGSAHFIDSLSGLIVQSVFYFIN